MRKTEPEAWMFVAFIASLIVVPFIVGMLAIKLYRQIKPLPQPDEQTNMLLALHTQTHDGFIKILITGWVLSSPMFYMIYRVWMG